MKKLWNIIKGNNPLITFICMVLLISLYVNFNYDTDIDRLEMGANQVSSQIDDLRRATFTNAIKEEVEVSGNKVNLVVSYMVDEIMSTYGSRSGAFNLDFSSPNPEKPLYKIINEGVTRLNDQSQENSRYIVTSRYGILSKYKTLTTEGNTDPTSIKILESVDMRYQYMMDNDIRSEVINTGKVDAKYETKDVVSLYTTGQSLEGYYLLIPTYITSNGDIFGTADFNSLGEPQKNYRLMILKVIKLSEVADSINPVISEIDTVSKGMSYQYNSAKIEELSRRVVSSIILFMAALGVLLYTQYVRISKRYGED